MVLAPLSRSIAFSTFKDDRNQPAIPSEAPTFENVFCDKDGNHVSAFLKKDLVYPETKIIGGCSRPVREAFIPAFWACEDSYEIAVVNSERSTRTVKCKIGKLEQEVVVPVITNTVQIKQGQSVVVNKNAAADEPEPKRPKVEAKTKGKSKGKGKGKR